MWSFPCISLKILSFLFRSCTCSLSSPLFLCAAHHLSSDSPGGSISGLCSSSFTLCSSYSKHSSDRKIQHLSHWVVIYFSHSCCLCSCTLTKLRYFISTFLECICQLVVTTTISSRTDFSKALEIILWQPSCFLFLTLVFYSLLSSFH